MVRVFVLPLYCFIDVTLSAGVFVKLCLFGVLGLCVAVQPLSPPGLQRVHCVDMCHYYMQNVVPAEIYRPSILLHKMPYGEYDCISLHNACNITLVWLLGLHRHNLRADFLFLFFFLGKERIFSFHSQQVTQVSSRVK